MKQTYKIDGLNYQQAIWIMAAVGELQLKLESEGEPKNSDTMNELQELSDKIVAQIVEQQLEQQL